MSEILREFFHRQRVLTAYGLLLLALTPLLLGLQRFDLRTLDDVDVWAKPAKFVFSVAVFALTTAWFFGYVQPARRSSLSLRSIVAIIILAGSFEIIYISWQAGHGLASHFNKSSVFFEVMYGLMGLGAVLLVTTSLLLAWEIGRRPAPGFSPDYLAAVVTGLVLCCVLGGGFGIYMSQQAGHSVGAVGGHAPIFGWNRAGGDLRIAHFMGIHAQQALPVLGLLIGGLSPLLRRPALIGGSLIYSAVALALFIQAFKGHPLMPNLF
ncbi:MAG TPA: hypothetical protein VGI65_11825 [Steroidobacteraceae bacterium]